MMKKAASVRCRQAKMHIGEETVPVYLGHNKLPELVAQLKALESVDKACAWPAHPVHVQHAGLLCM